MLELLEEAIELCGVPHELMTDNGTPFVAIVRTMLSRFQRSLEELRSGTSGPRSTRPGRTARSRPSGRRSSARSSTASSSPTSRRPSARSPPTPATTTTTGSTASSTGRRRPSGSTGRRSPTGAHPDPERLGHRQPPCAISHAHRRVRDRDRDTAAIGAGKRAFGATGGHERPAGLAGAGVHATRTDTHHRCE